ncbi:MAG: hypothetical protein CL508_01545 [Actinobacteria bacterium]|nr:hypothetical protein [Actinomycetota bacterium]
MKAYEIVTRRAEDYANRNQPNDVKLQPTHKDGALNLILECISWLDRMPGTKERKAPYTKRMWEAYLKAQTNEKSDDTMIVPQMIGGNRVEYLEDVTYDTSSLADSGIGTGGLGYASVKMKYMGTANMKGKKDPYWNPPKPTKARTLDGKEKTRAYTEYLAKRKR